MRTRRPRSLTSATGRSALLRSMISPLRLLVPLGMRISEHRAPLKAVRRSTDARLRCAHACFPYRTLNSSS